MIPTGLAVDLASCVRCGLCAEACHYYRTSADPLSTPAYKVRLAGEVIRTHGAMNPARTTELVDELFGRCSMCGRCMFHCTTGLNIPGLVRGARTRLGEAGLVPSDLQATVDTTLRSGNSMGITR
ncbi:MAG: 4Fe-4S dicluster domain-containing protein, partial [Acidobacteriota bacterium]